MVGSTAGQKHEAKRMSLTEHFSSEDLHPIDIVEHLAEHHDWDFDRVADDQIAMAVEGQWRTFSITLAWSPSITATHELVVPRSIPITLPIIFSGSFIHRLAGAVLRLNIFFDNPCIVVVVF